MNESRWTCKRCAREFDLEMGEGWIALAEEIPSSEHCKLTPSEPYETVCYECADELHAIVEKCNQDCTSCEAPKSWGLSIRDCLKFQQKFGLLNLRLPQGQVPVLGSLYEAKDVLISSRRKMGVVSSLFIPVRVARRPKLTTLM